MSKWQLQDAKAKFSEVVKSARKSPQEITVHGEPAAVILSIEEYHRLRRPKSSFVEFIRSSPLKGVELEISRSPSTGRRVRL